MGSQEDTDEDREKKKISDGVKRREEIIRGEEEKRWGEKKIRGGSGEEKGWGERR